MRLRDINDNRLRLLKQSRDILETAEVEKRKITPEEEARFDAIVAETDRLKQQMEMIIKQDLREKESAEAEERARLESKKVDISASPEQRAEKEKRVFNAWLRNGPNGLNAEERSWMESRAQSVGTDSAGGYLAPTGFQAQLEKSMLAFGGVRQVARVLQTADGNDLPWPTVNDHSNVGRILAENAQVTATDVTFASVTFNAYKYSSDIVLCSRELLQDSAIDISQVLADLLGERLARITNTHFTTGTGSGQPNGCVTAAGSASVVHDVSDTMNMNNWISHYHALNPAYRANASWMFHDDVLAAARKITYSTGTVLTPNWIWQPGMTPDAPDTILGKPYVVNQAMPQISGTNKIVLFGDFKKYVVRDCLGVTLLRLQERYADYFQVGFVAFSRHDGDLLDAGTDPIVYATTQA